MSLSFLSVAVVGGGLIGWGLARWYTRKERAEIKRAELERASKASVATQPVEHPVRERKIHPAEVTDFLAEGINLHKIIDGENTHAGWCDNQEDEMFSLTSMCISAYEYFQMVDSDLMREHWDNLSIAHKKAFARRIVELWTQTRKDIL